MAKEQERQPEGAPERAHHAGAGAPSGADASTPQRFSAAHKVAAVTRLLALGRRPQEVAHFIMSAAEAMGAVRLLEAVHWPCASFRPIRARAVSDQVA